MKIGSTILLLSGFLLAGASSRSQDSAAKPSAEIAGKKLFLQRCSVCHLPRLYDEDPHPYGPKLDGVVKSPETEERARKAIREGGPRMPGFQYGLEPGEIDDIIAYMKTMKAPAK
jgi:mono/diheme cytochrome c family protein